jgi:hypothetical protein
VYNGTLMPPVPQLMGSCTGRVARYRATLAANLGQRETGKQRGQPGGGAGDHPADSSNLFPSPVCHNTTLQHYRLPNVTTNVTRESVIKEVIQEHALCS